MIAARIATMFVFPPAICSLGAIPPCGPEACSDSSVWLLVFSGTESGTDAFSFGAAGDNVNELPHLMQNLPLVLL
jgi:hypothetical protein